MLRPQQLVVLFFQARAVLQELHQQVALALVVFLLQMEETDALERGGEIGVDELAEAVVRHGVGEAVDLDRSDHAAHLLGDVLQYRPEMRLLEDGFFLGLADLHRPVVEAIHAARDDFVDVLGAHLVVHREVRHRVLLHRRHDRPPTGRECRDHVDRQGYELFVLDDAVLVFVRLVDEHPQLVVGHTQVHLVQQLLDDDRREHESSVTADGVSHNVHNVHSARTGGETTASRSIVGQARGVVPEIRRK